MVSCEVGLDGFCPGVVAGVGEVRLEADDFSADEVFCSDGMLSRLF